MIPYEYILCEESRQMPNLCLQRQLFQEEETEIELAKMISRHESLKSSV